MRIPIFIVFALRLAGAFFAGSCAANAGEPVYLTQMPGQLPIYTNRRLHESSTLVARVSVTYAVASQQPSNTGFTHPRRTRAGSALLPGIEALIRLAAKTHDVEEALVRAVIEIESGFNPAARSPAGAMGLMQLMPGTARRYGVADAHDPAQNIDGGTRYLKDLIHMFGGDLRLALAGYNAGEGAVIRHGWRIPPFAETQAYVPAVLARYRNYLARALSDPAARQP